jgi:hypothetical protein
VGAPPYSASIRLETRDLLLKRSVRNIYESLSDRKIPFDQLSVDK